ncbi:hypothetical protein [Lachnospira sp.]|jgi:hypothetical protein|uniref:hypothetical protein n=1 Tax=Lachnospira sp. TaxID=2049031 RepID=UPI00257D351B|nr:hypothetical protein [Lachnospira sp.]
MEIIIFITLLILIISTLIYGFLIFNKKYYCKYFETEDWVKWEDILSKVDNIHLELIFEKSRSYWFTIDDYPNYRISLYKHNGKYVSCVNDEETCESVLCFFDNYHSDKLVKELFNILEKEKDSPNVRHNPY